MKPCFIHFQNLRYVAFEIDKHIFKRGSPVKGLSDDNYMDPCLINLQNFRYDLITIRAICVVLKLEISRSY